MWCDFPFSQNKTTERAVGEGVERRQGGGLDKI